MVNVEQIKLESVTARFDRGEESAATMVMKLRGEESKPHLSAEMAEAGVILADQNTAAPAPACGIHIVRNSI